MEGVGTEVGEVEADRKSHVDVGTSDTTCAFPGGSVKLKASGLTALPNMVAPRNTGLFTPKLVTTK